MSEVCEDPKYRFYTRRDIALAKQLIKELGNDFTYIFENEARRYTQSDLGIIRDSLGQLNTQNKNADKPTKSTNPCRPCTCSEPCMPDTCKRSLSNAECDESCIFGDNCKNKRLQALTSRPRVEIARSGHRGLCLKALTPFKQSSCIFELKGELIGKDLFNLRCQSGQTKHIASLRLNRTDPVSFLDFQNYGNESRFLRVSCFPNCFLQRIISPVMQKGQRKQVWKIMVLSAKEIEIGEELTIEKGAIIGYERCQFYCDCGLTGCRSKLFDKVLLERPQSVQFDLILRNMTIACDLFQKFVNEWAGTRDGMDLAGDFLGYFIDHFKKSRPVSIPQMLASPQSKKFTSCFHPNSSFEICNQLILTFNGIPNFKKWYDWSGLSMDATCYKNNLKDSYVGVECLNSVISAMIKQLQFPGKFYSTKLVDKISDILKKDEQYKGRDFELNPLESNVGYQTLCENLAKELNKENNFIEDIFQIVEQKYFICLHCNFEFKSKLRGFSKSLKVPTPTERNDAPLSVSLEKCTCSEEKATMPCPKCKFLNLRKMKQTIIKSPEVLTLTLERNDLQSSVEFPYLISIKTANGSKYYSLRALIEHDSIRQYKAYIVIGSPTVEFLVEGEESKKFITTSETEEPYKEDPITKPACLALYENVPLLAAFTPKVVDITNCVHGEIVDAVITLQPVLPEITEFGSHH